MDKTLGNFINMILWVNYAQHRSNPPHGFPYKTSYRLKFRNDVLIN